MAKRGGAHVRHNLRRPTLEHLPSKRTIQSIAPKFISLTTSASDEATSVSSPLDTEKSKTRSLACPEFSFPSRDPPPRFPCERTSSFILLHQGPRLEIWPIRSFHFHQEIQLQVFHVI